MATAKEVIEKMKNQSSNEITQNDQTNYDYHNFLTKSMFRVWDADPFKKTNELNIDAELNQVLIDLGKYLGNDMSGKFNPNLGLIIMGGVGTGKSLLLKSIYNLIGWMTGRETRFSGYKTEWTTARSIATLFRRSDFDGIAYIEKKNELFIDDVGTENPFLLVYGNREYPISEILYTRHEIKRRTYFTTNLDWNGIKAFYDDQDGRIMDRIKSNSNVIILDGKSWRS